MVSVEDALARARAAELDLVEIADKTDPHVCRIMNYGHFKYEKAKKQKEAKKKQRTITVKEMSFRPRTEEHDYQFKLRHIRAFLDEGNKVRVTIVYRGREMAHKDVGAKQLVRLEEDLSDIAGVEQQPSFEGRRLSVTFAPIPGKISGGKRAKAEDESGGREAVPTDQEREDQAAEGVRQPSADAQVEQTETTAAQG